MRAHKKELCGEFSAGQAQSKVVEIKNLDFPTVLDVHLEDMF
jgi:hypothetical protein